MRYRLPSWEVGLAGLSACLGAAVLSGWYLKIEALIQVHSSFVPMQYNTALGFLLCGTGLVLCGFKQHRTAAALGCVVSLLGVSTLFQYAFDTGLGIDQLFMDHYVDVYTPNPGRMSANTALCFTLTGIGVFVRSGLSALNA